MCEQDQKKIMKASAGGAIAGKAVGAAVGAVAEVCIPGIGPVVGAAAVVLCSECGRVIAEGVAKCICKKRKKKSMCKSM